MYLKLQFLKLTKLIIVDLMIQASILKDIKIESSNLSGRSWMLRRDSCFHLLSSRIAFGFKLELTRESKTTFDYLLFQVLAFKILSKFISPFLLVVAEYCVKILVFQITISNITSNLRLQLLRLTWIIFIDLIVQASTYKDIKKFKPQQP